MVRFVLSKILRITSTITNFLFLYNFYRLYKSINIANASGIMIWNVENFDKVIFWFIFPIVIVIIRDFVDCEFANE